MGVEKCRRRLFRSQNDSELGSLAGHSAAEEAIPMERDLDEIGRLYG